MDTVRIVACVVASSGLLIFLLALPLVLGRVPPNGLYGLRTRASLSSEREWYRLNRLSGRALLVSGFIILLTGGAGFFIPAAAHATYPTVAAIISLGVIILPCLLIGRKAPPSPRDQP